MPIDFKAWVTPRNILVLLGVIIGLVILIFALIGVRSCGAPHAGDVVPAVYNTPLLEAQHGQAEANVYLGETMAALPPGEKVTLWLKAWAK